MTKHTPSPWAYHFEPTLNRHIVRAGFAGERNICVAYGAGLKSCEAAANMRLIAAAPDLLEAVKLFVECDAFIPRLGKETPDDSAADNERRATVYAIARAAIAKAVGAEV
jgi:hypothetical protein